MQLAPVVTPQEILSFDYSNGMRGVAQTVGILRAMVRDFRKDPAIRNAATSAIFLSPRRDHRHEIEALLTYVRQQVRYVPDIHEIETISTPTHTLASRVGDCDDMASLLASLLESVGFPTRFVVAGYSDPTTVEHIYLQAFADGEWIDLDPTEYFPAGIAPPGAVSLWIEGV